MLNSTEQQRQGYAAGSAESGSTGASAQRKVEVGSVWASKNCGNFVVTSFDGCLRVFVKFTETGTIKKTTSQNVRSGEIKDNLHPSVYGIGFIGTGQHKPSIGRRITPAYNCWYNMMTRCYNPKYQEKKPTYIGCTVCDEWHNFQNFAEWYYENHPQDGSDWHLDKDLTVIGNKQYSPEACAFMPVIVNLFIVDCASARGEFMIGSAFDARSKRFKSYCQNPITGVNERLGDHGSELSAHMAWRKRKSEHCDSLIAMHTHDHVKLAIRNYKYALDNNLIYTY